MIGRRAVLAMAAAACAERAIARELEPGLARYREANALLPPPTARRVVFMGDSITEFWEGFPAFAAPNRIGRGISGQTAIQMRLRFRQDVVALRPRVVHLMAGTNDVAGNLGAETDAEYQAAMRAMVGMAQGDGIRLVLASIPPAAAFDWHPELKPVPRIRRLNDWLRAYATERRAIYADYWPALATPGGAMKPGMSTDGVHPTALGYAAMMPVAEAAIAQAFGAR